VVGTDAALDALQALADRVELREYRVLALLYLLADVPGSRLT
jgi:hypothetical protein